MPMAIHQIPIRQLIGLIGLVGNIWVKDPLCPDSLGNGRAIIRIMPQIDGKLMCEKVRPLEKGFHSTSQPDGMEDAHEWKHNSHCTKCPIQSNPDTDMRRWIVDNVSRWKLDGKDSCRSSSMRMLCRRLRYSPRNSF